MGHRSGLPGSPDVVFPRARLAIFLDGCFWHGCKQCRSIPVTNRAFWVAKLQGNMKRDERADSGLRAIGWKVMRIWEHELKTDRNGVLHEVLVGCSRGQARAPSRHMTRAEARSTRLTAKRDDACLV